VTNGVEKASPWDCPTGETGRYRNTVGYVTSTKHRNVKPPGNNVNSLENNGHAQESNVHLQETNV